MTHLHAIAREFQEPIGVFGALGFVLQVRTVDEAYAFLAESPARRATSSRNEAIAACKSVLAGRAGVEKAERAFRRYADRAGILVPEGEDEVTSAPRRLRSLATPSEHVAGGMLWNVTPTGRPRSTRV